MREQKNNFLYAMSKFSDWISSVGITTDLLGHLAPSTTIHLPNHFVKSIFFLTLQIGMKINSLL